MLSPEKTDAKILEEIYGFIPEPEDRAQFIRFVEMWKPRKGLCYDAQPGMVRIYRDNEILLDAAWISLSPVVLWLNGKLLVGSDNGSSIYRGLETLFNENATRSAWFESLTVPSAFAEDNLLAPEQRQVLFAFSLVDTLKTVENLIKKNPGVSRAAAYLQAKRFDHLNFITGSGAGKVQCTADGHEPITFTMNDQKFTLTSKGGRT